MAVSLFTPLDLGGITLPIAGETFSERPNDNSFVTLSGL